MDRERVALTARALELEDQQDRRQADHADRRLDMAERSSKRRYRLLAWTLAAGAIPFLAAVALIMWMLFFGDPQQAARASGLLEVVFTGLGGFGIGYAVLSAIRRLFRR